MEGMHVGNIQVNIKEWKKSAMDQQVVIYVIEIAKRDDKWTIEKRYREFDELNSNLKKTYANLPNMPGKSLFKITEPEQIEERKKGLESYIKVLLTRQDIFNSEAFKQFLQLDKHASESIINPPKILGELTGFVHGVRDFFYEKTKGIMFILSGDMNVASRMDAYLTNMKMPWEKDAPPTLLSVGALECWAQTSETEYKFDRLWSKTFPKQAICMYWDSNSSSLFIGLDEGKLNQIKIPQDSNFIRYDDVLEKQIHEERIMGVYYDPIQEIIYTVSEDKTFKTTQKNEVTNTLKPSSYGLTFLIGDKEYKRAFLSDRGGNVFIYDISSSTPQLLVQMQTQSKGAIRGLAVDVFKNYVFAGGFDDGEITIFNIEKPGKEKLWKLVASLKGKLCARYIEWSSKAGEIYAGYKDGTITFWSTKKGDSFYVLQAHQSDITKLQFFEDKKLLLTSSKEKVIKFWQLPKEWRDTRLVEQEEKEYEAQKKKENITLSQQQQKKALEDSDEDDLKGWHRL